MQLVQVWVLNHLLKYRLPTTGCIHQTDSLSQTSASNIPYGGEAVSPFSIYARTLANLLLCRSNACSHSFCELRYIVALSHLENAILIQAVMSLSLRTFLSPLLKLTWNFMEEGYILSLLQI